jgi:hypothetical protein
MKRLIPCLIVAAFLLGIFGARAAQAHANLKIRASSQGCLQISVYLPCIELSTKWDTVENLPPPPGNGVFTSKPSRVHLLPADWLSPTSQKLYGGLGSGCGGLPS